MVAIVVGFAGFSGQIGERLASLDGKVADLSAQIQTSLDNQVNIAETQTALYAVPVNPPPGHTTSSTFCFSANGVEIKINVPSVGGISFQQECQNRGGTVMSSQLKLFYPSPQYNIGGVRTELTWIGTSSIQWQQSDNIKSVSIALYKNDALIGTVARSLSASSAFVYVPGVSSTSSLPFVKYPYYTDPPSYSYQWSPSKVFSRSLVGQDRFKIGITGYSSSNTPLITTKSEFPFSIIDPSLMVSPLISNKTYSRGEKNVLVGSYRISPQQHDAWLTGVTLTTNGAGSRFSNLRVLVRGRSFGTSTYSNIRNGETYAFIAPSVSQDYFSQYLPLSSSSVSFDIYADVNASSTPGSFGPVFMLRGCQAVVPMTENRPIVSCSPVSGYGFPMRSFDLTIR